MALAISQVWGPAPSQGEEGSGTTGKRALFQCPECGHDQSNCSVVLRVRLNAHASRTRQLSAMFHTAILWHHWLRSQYYCDVRALPVKIIAKVSTCAVFWLWAVDDAVKNGNYCIPQEQHAYTSSTRPFLSLWGAGPQTTISLGHSCHNEWIIWGDKCSQWITYTSCKHLSAVVVFYFTTHDYQLSKSILLCQPRFQAPIIFSTLHKKRRVWYFKSHASALIGYDVCCLPLCNSIYCSITHDLKHRYQAFLFFSVQHRVAPGQGYNFTPSTD